MRAALAKGIRAFGELVGQKKAKDISGDDIVTGSEIMLSVFIREPEVVSTRTARPVRGAAVWLNGMCHHFDHWSPPRVLAARPAQLVIE